MSQTIGIDLGTTYSCVSYLEGNEPKIIPNLEGMQTTPSVVSFTSSGEKLIGNLALRQAITNPQNTIFAIKRLMGKKFNSEEVQEARKKIPYELAEAPNADVIVQVDSNTISPQEISAMILGYLKKCAETFFGDEVTQAVITVPAHFDDHQRQATKDAAQIAGLEVLRVINEPTAASLAYGLETKKDATIAVYDMGGGTFDITLMEINEGIFHVLGTNGNSYLGGDDFDNRIVSWLIEEFEKENGVDLSDDKLALQRIKEAAEKAKRELSYTLETEINLPFIGSDKSGSKHLKQVITRTKLEELTKDLIQETFLYIDQSLTDANLDADKIDEVILVGGQTRMPLIKELITDFFKKKPIERINPDEIVAMGASIQTAIIKGTLKDLILLLDVTPLSLGIETENERFVKIIEKNTTIPTKQTMAFTTVEHDQRRVRVHILQGESENIRENISLAVFDLVGIATAPAGVPQIDVTFEIDADGIARVSAKDLTTGRKQGIEVRPTSGLTPEEIHSIIRRTHEKESE
ncbi:MAG: molecular chaperone DnaK [Candidatus Aminicenantes bacterium]|nr:molecular chaperone DnaK [Candidatus Aminicenantes bacterium]